MRIKSPIISLEVIVHNDTGPFLSRFQVFGDLPVSIKITYDELLNICEQANDETVIATVYTRYDGVKIVYFEWVMMPDKNLKNT